MGKKPLPVKVFSFNSELLPYHFGCLTSEPAAKHPSGTEQTPPECQTSTSGWKDGLQHYCTTIQIGPESHARIIY